jgi:DNA-binding response OmpR family regulator
MHKILIIEDDLALRRGLVDNFVAEGYDVRSAADGEIGLDMLLDSVPDLVLLDIMLPKVNGYEICSAVRREGLKVPIIMLTAKGQESDIVRGLELGADDYVTKPFSIRELIARVKAFLRRHRMADTSVFTFGDCRLDRSSHSFTKKDKVVTLTSKEFRLLEYFLENEGRALTRSAIMSGVWGSSIMVTQRSVDRCVTTLRSKIENEPGRPRHIKTVREIGYRFESGN